MILMKFRKALSAALALSTFVSATSVVSYAEMNKEMKTALTYVKQRVDIPERLEAFNYNSYDYYKQKTYDFSWSGEENEKFYEQLNISISGKIITKYNYYSYSYADTRYNEQPSFGKLSRDEILKKAEEYIAMLNPTVKNNIAIDKDSLYIDLTGTGASVGIYRVSGGVRVSGQSGRIRIDKNTGALISYDLSWVRGAGFEDPAEAITPEEAYKAFESEMPAELFYAAEEDYEKKEYIPHLVYKQSETGVINALTGKTFTFDDYRQVYDDLDNADGEICEDEAAADAGAGGSVSFTDEEIEKMEQENKLLTNEKIIETLSGMGIFYMGENPVVTSSYTYFNDWENAYFKQVEFTSSDTEYYPVDDEPMPVDEAEPIAEPGKPAINKNYVRGNFSINAETGEITSFYSYGNKKYEDVELNQPAVKALTDKYFGMLAGDKAAAYKPEAALLTSEVNGIQTVYGGSASSPKYAYDIPSSVENMDMTLNTAGKITQYYINDKDIEYPKPENIISAEEAYGKYFEQSECELEHRIAIKESNVLTAMVYKDNTRFFIDAFSGKLTDYNGREIKSAGYGGSYTDLENSEYKEIAELLENYGIVIKDEKGRLNENKAITRNNFAMLLRSAGISGYNVSNLNDKPLTRQFAAKIITSNVLGEECAELPGVFKSPFSDVKSDSKYVGYIAVANALGYLKGENGRFRPADIITNGDALMIVYNILSGN